VHVARSNNAPSTGQLSSYVSGGYGLIKLSDMSLTLALVPAIWLGTWLGDDALKRMAIRSLASLHLGHFDIRRRRPASANAVVKRKPGPGLAVTTESEID
jgi:hypothetical protein